MDPEAFLKELLRKAGLPEEVKELLGGVFIFSWKDGPSSPRVLAGAIMALDASADDTTTNGATLTFATTLSEVFIVGEQKAQCITWSERTGTWALLFHPDDQGGDMEEIHGSFKLL